MTVIFMCIPSPSSHLAARERASGRRPRAFPSVLAADAATRADRSAPAPRATALAAVRQPMEVTHSPAARYRSRALAATRGWRLIRRVNGRHWTLVALARFGPRAVASRVDERFANRRRRVDARAGREWSFDFHGGVIVGRRSGDVGLLCIRHVASNLLPRPLTHESCLEVARQMLNVPDDPMAYFDALETPCGPYGLQRSSAPRTCG